MSTTYLEREEASKILKVSTRTVDRYIRKYRFKTRKKGRRILIRRTDVDKIIREHIGHFVDVDNVAINKIFETPDVDKASNIHVKDVAVKEVKKKEEKPDSADFVYKRLYEETKQELREKQDRLEAATYRVGQLEAQAKSMVPLLDFTQKEKELKEAQRAVEQKALEGQQQVIRMQRRLKAERIAKWIYLSLVGLLLVAEPILFLLWAFS